VPTTPELGGGSPGGGEQPAPGDSTGEQSQTVPLRAPRAAGEAGRERMPVGEEEGACLRLERIVDRRRGRGLDIDLSRCRFKHNGPVAHRAYVVAIPLDGERSLERRWRPK